MFQRDQKQALSSINSSEISLNISSKRKNSLTFQSYQNLLSSFKYVDITKTSTDNKDSISFNSFVSKSPSNTSCVTRGNKSLNSFSDKFIESDSEMPRSGDSSHDGLTDIDLWSFVSINTIENLR